MLEGHHWDVKTHALHIHRPGSVEAGELPLVFNICAPMVGDFLVWITRTQIHVFLPRVPLVELTSRTTQPWLSVEELDTPRHSTLSSTHFHVSETL